MSKGIIMIILGAIALIEGIMFLLKKGDWLFRIGLLRADPETTDMDKLLKVNGAGFTLGGIVIIIGGYIWNSGNETGKWIVLATVVAVIVFSVASFKFCRK